MRINSVPDVKCFYNNKNVLCAQSMVRRFVRRSVYSGILKVVLLVSKAMELYTSRAHKSVRKCHTYFIFYVTDTKNKLWDSGTEYCVY